MSDKAASDYQKMEKALKRLGFTASQKLISAVGSKSGVAFDERSKKLCLLKLKQDGTVKSRIFSHRDILKCEILDDGFTTIKTSRTSQAAGECGARINP